MNKKSYIFSGKRVLLFIIFTLFFALSNGQQTPFYPVSYRIFNPFIFNPAIAGSKDYFSVDLLTSKYGKANSQVLGGNLRLTKPNQDYYTSRSTPEFTNIGVGGFLFNEDNEFSHVVGINGSGSYHLQLDDDAISFLSLGVSAKAIFNTFKGDPDLGKPKKTTFVPNVDAGIYYYNPNLYAGFSVTNLLGSPEDVDSTGFKTIQVSRQFFFQMGYKFVLSKSLNILLEPSLIVNYDDSLSKKPIDMIQPALKLYAGNFCLGTYFNDFDKTSFFVQYKYPRFFIGAYFALPNNSPFYKSPILAEITLGINISSIKSGSTRLNHW